MDLRRLSALAALLCGLAVLIGCGWKPAAQQAAAPSNRVQPSENKPLTADTGTTTKSVATSTAPTSKPVTAVPAPTPRRTLKPAGELKIPAGLEEPPSEMKAAKSGWEYIAQAQVGDYAELEMNGTRFRTEIFDIADMAIVQINDFTAQAGEKPTRTVTKMLFTEPELDPNSEYYVKFEKKPSNRKFTIGGKEYQADTVTEGYKDGILVSKTWTSKRVPLGSLLMEDGEGKVTSRLISFGRK
jgi:hypothetical protein